MLTIKQITEDTEKVIKGLQKKHFDNAKETIDKDGNPTEILVETNNFIKSDFAINNVLFGSSKKYFASSVLILCIAVSL